MGSKKIRIPRPKFDPELIQINAMRAHYPTFWHYWNENKNLVFKGTVQPLLTMPCYTVTIEYRKTEMPKVKIVSPQLVAKPPHFYHSEGCLCLYKPTNFKWTAGKPLSNYIVSWTASWIYFYEVWKQDGIWYGPEADHENDEIK